MLLKVILCAYAQGVVSSRRIERLYREHVSCLDREVARLFAQVLYLCDRQGLIGREMFAIDSVKLPAYLQQNPSPASQFLPQQSRNDR